MVFATFEPAERPDWRRVLTRTGWLLIAVGLLHVAVLADDIRRGSAYLNAIGILGLAFGPWLIKHNLRAAGWILDLSALALAFTISMFFILLASEPQIVMVALKASDRNQMVESTLLTAISWVTLALTTFELSDPAINYARRLRGRMPTNPLVPAAFGISVSLLIAAFALR
jgi:hypothetical protein